MYTPQDHTFVICAYRDNPYLEKTARSLLGQTASGHVMLATSTPSDYITDICSKLHIEMVVNPERGRAGDDWNFAYMSAPTSLVTLAHQDDYYEPCYVERILEYVNRYTLDRALILFSDYYEIRNGEREDSNRLLQIKRIMNTAFRIPGASASRFVRHRVLSFGSPICCPAVTYVKKNIGPRPFDTHYVNSCDYKTFVDLSDLRGYFIYVPERLLGHRIYEESATSRNLADNIRRKEDYEILQRFWPRWISRIVNDAYSTSEKSNELR